MEGDAVGTGQAHSGGGSEQWACCSSGTVKIELRECASILQQVIQVRQS